MSAEQPTIIYTLTDEAPLLATYAFLPIIRTFTGPAGINVESTDISVAARILAEFSDHLTEEQRVPDNLAELGKLTQLPIPTSSSCRTSAPRCRNSRPPSRNCRQGLRDPGYPGDPKTDEEKDIKQRTANAWAAR